MFNANDILTRLQAGETSEQIAAEMAAALNEAIAKRDAAEAAAREAAQKREARLDDLATRITVNLMEYLTLSDPDVATVFEQEVLDVAEVRQSLDGMIPLLSSAARLVASFEECSKESNQKAESKAANKVIDPITEFLKKNGLL